MKKLLSLLGAFLFSGSLYAITLEEILADPESVIEKAPWMEEILTQKIIDTDALEAALSAFFVPVFNSIPNALSQQNVWAAAWMGNMPNFGVGVSAGLATIDLAALKTIAQKLGFNGSADTLLTGTGSAAEKMLQEQKVMLDDIPDTFILPTATIDLRIGGFFLPFDIGLSFIMLNIPIEDPLPLTFDFLSLGADLRFALIKDEGTLGLSLSAGYNYTATQFLVGDKSKNFATFDFTTHSIQATAQVSKDLRFFTPYVGFRAIIAMTSISYQWGVNGYIVKLPAFMFADIPLDLFKDWLGTITYESEVYGIESEWAFHPQIILGASIRLLVIQITLGISADILTKVVGGNLSVRFRMGT